MISKYVILPPMNVIVAAYAILITGLAGIVYCEYRRFKRRREHRLFFDGM